MVFYILLIFGISWDLRVLEFTHPPKFLTLYTPGEIRITLDLLLPAGDTSNG